MVEKYATTGYDQPAVDLRLPAPLYVRSEYISAFMLLSENLSYDVTGQGRTLRVVQAAFDESAKRVILGGYSQYQLYLLPNRKLWK